MMSRKQTLASDVLASLEAKKLSLATAESCTGGGVGQALTAVPGSSRVYRGGIISYTNEVKSALLHVPETLLRDLGPSPAQWPRPWPGRPGGPFLRTWQYPPRAWRARRGWVRQSGGDGLDRLRRARRVESVLCRFQGNRENPGGSLLPGAGAGFGDSEWAGDVAASAMILPEEWKKANSSCCKNEWTVKSGVP